MQFIWDMNRNSPLQYVTFPTQIHTFCTCMYSAAQNQFFMILSCMHTTKKSVLSYINTNHFFLLWATCIQTISFFGFELHVYKLFFWFWATSKLIQCFGVGWFTFPRWFGGLDESDKNVMVSVQKLWQIVDIRWSTKRCRQKQVENRSKKWMDLSIDWSVERSIDRTIDEWIDLSIEKT